MNRIYSIVWSTSTSAWVVASELATGGTRARPAARALLRRALLAATIGGILGVAPPLRAQSLYWDGADTDSNANGGTGTWDNTLANWDTSATAGANAVWSNALPNAGVFGGGGLVTIGAGGVTARGLTFIGGGYTFNGASLTLSGTSPAIDVGGATNIAFNVVLAGDDGLLKTNTGTLRVDGPATAVFADVNVQGGTLAIGAAGTITGATSTTIAQGAILQVDGTFAGTAAHDTFVVSGNVRGAGTVSLGGGNDVLHLMDGEDLTA